MKREVTVRRPRSAAPFFNLGGRWYVDVLHNFREPLTVSFADVMRFLIEVPPEAVVLGRRLTSQEQRTVLRDRDDADADTYARLIGDDRSRWSKSK